MRSVFIRLICLSVLSITSLGYASEAENDIKNMGALVGYVQACAEISHVTATSQEKQEFKLFGQKFISQYLHLGQQGADLFLKNVPLGLFAGGMDNGAQCEKALKEMTYKMKSFGLSGAYLERVLGSGKFDQQQNSTEISNIQSAKIKSGLYSVQNDTDEVPDIVLKANKTGSFSMDEESEPFEWKIEGNKLVIQMLDYTLPTEHQSFIATIKNDTTLVLDETEYKRNDNLNISSYTYAEEGYAGNMTLYDWNRDDGIISTEIETSDNQFGNTCELEIHCKNKGSMLICRDSEDQDEMILIQDKGNDTMEVSGTISTYNFCGIRGNFFGKYTKLKE